jgi:hypothetical protein
MVVGVGGQKQERETAGSFAALRMTTKTMAKAKEEADSLRE